MGKPINEESYAPLLEWINREEHDFFWLEQLRRDFGCLNADEREFPMNVTIKALIYRLCHSGAIQCTEFRKSRRQYYRARIVTIGDLEKV